MNEMVLIKDEGVTQRMGHLYLPITHLIFANPIYFSLVQQLSSLYGPNKNTTLVPKGQSIYSSINKPYKKTKFKSQNTPKAAACGFSMNGLYLVKSTVK